jgi:hypothetical protein
VLVAACLASIRRTSRRVGCSSTYLTALAPFGRAVIVAGAQAIYLLTGDADLAVAPYTTDADLTLDPSLLGDEPELGAGTARGTD